MKNEKLLRSFGGIADKYIIEAKPKAKKPVKLFGKPVILSAAICAFLALCAFAAAMHFRMNVIFPASDKGKTEYNAAIYEIEPFALSVELPENWSYKEREPGADFAGHFAFFEILWSVFDIYDESGEFVGAVGYNIYENYEGAEEDDPRAIYSQIALGNHYHFDVRESYAVVKETEYGKTATADVYYSANINGGTEMKNKGILSYNRDLSVYVAMEFESALVTDEQIANIAKSVLIYKN
ncbi:MAG: hypothetical protein FWG34_05420 [Oscillospiraceae bacterium]|nr:hypothetical protein [Oscillospiraceae bacterium]